VSTAAARRPGGPGGTATFHRYERHGRSLTARLNWLRAGVLGANDGIISIAALLIGVAAAATSTHMILSAGLAGLIAGAASMGLGEYVSVSSQRDAELALVSEEQEELERMPSAELSELVGLLQWKGLSTATSQTVARELTAHDALAAHLELELGIDRETLVNPWAAALSSMLSFTVGALLPLIAMLLPPSTARVPVTFVVVIGALCLTGALSAHLGGSPKRRAILRLVLGGTLAMLVTFAIGGLLGVTVG
jgi:VIT1/CCC1 family predicted Fe2+/Mn2+ transporter